MIVNLVDTIQLQDSISLSVDLNLKIPANIKWLEVRVGSEEGTGDFLALNLLYHEAGGKKLFKTNDKEYDVSKGLISLTGIATKSHINQKCFIVLTAKDSSGNIIYTTSKKIK